MRFVVALEAKFSEWLKQVIRRLEVGIVARFKILVGAFWPKSVLVIARRRSVKQNVGV